MGDLFHEEVPIQFIDHVFKVMDSNPRHTFQVLTKRAPRMAALGGAAWHPNIWAGVTVENQQAADQRIPDLLKCSAAVRFVSCEPLLGPIDLTRINYGTLECPSGSKPVVINALDNTVEDRINWVILGGESGPGARLMEKEWVLDIKRQCDKANVPFFFKQWGGVNKKKAGRRLQGRTWDAMPVIAESPDDGS